MIVSSEWALGLVFKSYVVLKKEHSSLASSDYGNEGKGQTTALAKSDSPTQRFVSTERIYKYPVRFEQHICMLGSMSL